MSWYQVNVEGSQPQVRVSHTATILHRAGSEGCSVNEIGRVVVYGGKSTAGSPGGQFTDLAFMSVGVGCTDEIAKPQSRASQAKLNKLLGGAGGNSLLANGASNHNGGVASLIPAMGSTTIATTTSNITNTANTSPPLSSFQAVTKRKSYSKLPLYSGSVLYHWENSATDGTSPGTRTNHSLVAINAGTHKGNIVLYGGVDGEGTLVSDDLFILDTESLWWERVRPLGLSPGPRHSHYSCQISPELGLKIELGPDKQAR
eukprot:gene16926-20134_t